jgi:hypothetical protein
MSTFAQLLLNSSFFERSFALAGSQKYFCAMILSFLTLNSVSRAQNIARDPKDITASSESDPSSLKDSDLPVEYRKFSHTILVDSFRGGSYEKDGVSRYYFRVSIFATQVNKAEGDSSKKIVAPVGSFGEMSLKSLDIWKRDDKAKSGNHELRIDGDLIRDTVARAMLDWLVPESDVQISVLVELWRHAKKFGLLGEDVKIAEATYQLIPSMADASTGSGSLVLSDDKGSSVRIRTKFDYLGSAAKEQKDK